MADVEARGGGSVGRWAHQVSLVVLHPRRADQVVLLAPPVPEAAEEVVGEEAVDGVSDDVDVHGLLHPKPDRKHNILAIGY